MRTLILFVTGTDTGVGKSVFAALLALHLRRIGVRVAALKPIASGGRDDARLLREALGDALTLDEISPWHFRAPVAPLLAARRERRRVMQQEVVAHLRSIGRRFEVVIVEGAGGLLSPLGERFNSRDLIVALSARPVVVAPDRLGVVNQVLLTLEALPAKLAAQAAVVLMEPSRPDAVTRTNVALLGEFLTDRPIHQLPWLGDTLQLEIVARRRTVRRTLAALMRNMS